MPPPDVETAIRTEYEWLCRTLGLSPVTLDVYEFAPASTDVTIPGTPLAESNPGFSPGLARIWLPTTAADVLPKVPPAAPKTWLKQAPEWAPWRIELWHEVLHQLSANLGVYDAGEPGRQRTDGSWSTKGHGIGWWTSVQAAASKLGCVTPDELDSLLDR